MTQEQMVSKFLNDVFKPTVDVAKRLADAKEILEDIVDELREFNEREGK